MSDRGLNSAYAYFVNNIVWMLALCFGTIACTACVGLSFYEKKVLGYDMFGEIYPAVVFGSLGCLTGSLSGLIPGGLYRLLSRW